MPREAIEDLYEQWNDVAEGFGVDKEESSEIFSVLQETLDMAKKPLASISDLLFDVYDTDNVSEARRSFTATPWRVATRNWWRVWCGRLGSRVPCIVPLHPLCP